MKVVTNTDLRPIPGSQRPDGWNRLPLIEQRFFHVNAGHLFLQQENKRFGMKGCWRADKGRVKRCRGKCSFKTGINSHGLNSRCRRSFGSGQRLPLAAHGAYPVAHPCQVRQVPSPDRPQPYDQNIQNSFI